MSDAIHAAPHDLSMPHDSRYADVRGCPPNCPHRIVVTQHLRLADKVTLTDQAVWAAVMAGPKAGEDADDPRVVRRMLDAARQVCAGAFPRCPTSCDADCEQPCHEVHSIPPRRAHDPGACVGVIVATAVAAERERCVAFAERHKATYDETRPCNCGRIHPRTGEPCTVLLRSGLPFAALLRQEPGPGEAGHPGPQASSEGKGAP